jgi:transposase
VRALPSLALLLPAQDSSDRPRKLFLTKRFVELQQVRRRYSWQLGESTDAIGALNGARPQTVHASRTLFFIPLANKHSNLKP